MARSRVLLLLLLLLPPQQLHLGWVLSARTPAVGLASTPSPSPEENEFLEGPVLILSPEEPKPGPATVDCPRECTCSQEGVVDCSGIDLREFPGDLPEHTNHLSLQNNQLEKIYPKELSRLHLLETLNLQNNRLTSRGLPEEAFEHLTSLNYLYLANNKLTLAPRFLPNTLVSVDFAANYLTKIYGLTFGQKPNLRSVYLHNNKLADAGLPDNMFNGSSNVEVLILSSNFLRHVPKHLPPALYKLHLKNNKLEKIPPGAFSELSHLRELYLQNNHLTDESLDNETFWKLSSLEYLDLSSNNLSRVPAGLPRSLVLLHLEKNAIRSVDADVLTPIRSLEYLLLHSNQLRAHGIHPLAFQGLKKLHTVHLYNNALERVPRGLPRRVRTLMILHNQIAGIGRDDFATTYFLEELNLSYNRITSAQVHRDAFRKLRLLRSLDLSGNRLQTLPQGLPRNVHVLKVKRNELVALARGALAGMAQLSELYLTGNRLRSRALGPRAWADLAHLQLLDIAGNQLTEIPEGLPESLEYLYLQNNRISTVPANAFDATPNLKGIFLRFNKLAVGSVVDSAFRRLKHLQVLDIEGSFEFGDISKDHGHDSGPPDSSAASHVPREPSVGHAHRCYQMPRCCTQGRPYRGRLNTPAPSCSGLRPRHSRAGPHAHASCYPESRPAPPWHTHAPAPMDKCLSLCRKCPQQAHPLSHPSVRLSPGEDTRRPLCSLGSGACRPLGLTKAGFCLPPPPLVDKNLWDSCLSPHPLSGC